MGLLIFETIKNDKDLDLPYKKRETDAGNDLFALEGGIIWPFQTKVIPSNHKTLIHPGYFGFIQARSGIRKRGMLIEGIIDAGYTGTIGIMITNATPFPRIIKKGDRIAQMMIIKYENVLWKEVEEFSTKTDRGEDGGLWRTKYDK